MYKLIRKPITVHNHQVMTYSMGEGDETLLLISGGPGCPSACLREAHQCYADQGFRVVTWDQLGCGESDHVADPALWNIPRFVEEVAMVRESLDLNNIHIMGHSWGGVLGLEYILAYPDVVKSFIINSTAFNIPLMQRGFERIKLALGDETLRMMARHEGNGTIDHPEYQAVATILSYRHLCRLQQWPESLKEMMQHIAQPMLSAVFGRYLFNCTGLLRNHDRTQDLHKVKQPCLILHGECDYIIPECAMLTRDYLPNAELVIFENCSHGIFLEAPKQYHEVLGKFLQKHRH